MSATGGTNIGGGLEAGLQQLIHSGGVWNSEGSRSPRLGRILLMSDGNSNVGIRARSEFEALVDRAVRQGISISTLGVGLDYNEDLMTLIGNRGGGQYHFVAPETAIGTILDAEWMNLTQAVAQKTSVTVDFGEGVSLVEALSLIHI